MRVLISDIETEQLENPQKVWLCGGKDLSTGQVTTFRCVHDSPEEKRKAIQFYQSFDRVVGHNFIQFDLGVLTKHLGKGVIPPEKVIDTVVISRLVDYGIQIPMGGDYPHSLKSWGIRFKLHKGDHSDWSQLTPEMEEYWLRDLEVTERLYNHFKKKLSTHAGWRKAVKIEHQTQIELVRAKHHGFCFDVDKGTYLLEQVRSEMEELEKSFQEAFPPAKKEVHRLPYRLNKDGSENVHIKNNREKFAFAKVEGSDIVFYDWVAFNPGSPAQRLEVLNESGWSPTEKTKAHEQFLRKKVGDKATPKGKPMTEAEFKERKKHFNKYGWKCSAENLQTLSPNAPKAAKDLVEWLVLEARRSSLEEWLGQVKEDGRIHGNINSVGSWTGRCSHTNPNTANIAACFEGEAKTPVERVFKRYNTNLRSCWRATNDDWWMLGVDADGIQLRVLADYLWRHFGATQYAHAIMDGKKEDETDIHNLNKQALGLPHLTRDDAKTFIYAWLLGAGDAKTARILRVPFQQARPAKQRFETSIEGLSRLKKELIPFIAERGYFQGYDGRLVKVPSEHHTLAGILQNGEAVLMKHTLVKVCELARKKGFTFRLVGFVHDELIFEVKGSEENACNMGDLVLEVMLQTGKELGFKIPTPGTKKIGRDWSQSH